MMQVEVKEEGVIMLGTIVAWIILGAIAGYIASVITGTDRQISGWANVVVGIVGAFIGGLIVQLYGSTGVTGLNWGSLLVAILGAVVLLALMRAFRSNRI
jgi:uncharacterized membrane protein YeaQ/YmgE (transglycosylase-associated protein family)